MGKSKRHGLYKRGGDLYAFRYKDREGKWREKSTGKTDYQQAREVKDDFDENNKKQTLPTKKSTWKVADAAALWVQQHAAHLGSEKVKSNERSLLRQLVRRLGERKLRSITIDDIKTYQAERHLEVGERAVNLELRILVHVLKEANLWAPIAQHYKPLKERESEIGQALSPAQLHALEMKAATNPAWDVAYHAEVLAANTGLRGCELKRLRLVDVDLELRRIRIRRAKTDAGQRLVELNQAATEAVSKLYVRAQTLGASAPDHFLLPTDLSRHTKDCDPLKGGIGFDATKHQTSWAERMAQPTQSSGIGWCSIPRFASYLHLVDGGARSAASGNSGHGGTHERQGDASLYSRFESGRAQGRGVVGPGPLCGEFCGENRERGKRAV